MDPADPENRIAELERQLAEQERMAMPERQQAGPVNSPVVTPEYVHNVAFSKPAIGQRGYNEDEVDTFLDLVVAALRDPTGHTLTPEQVRNVAFSKPPIGKRGYNEHEVDAFVDLVEQQLTSQQAGAIGQSPPLLNTQMVAGQQSVVYPGHGGPQYFGAPAGVGPQPAFAGQPGFGRERGSRPKRWRLGIGLPAIGLVVLLLGPFGFAVHDTYVYFVGTPTTATIEQCTPGFQLQSSGQYHHGGAGGIISKRVIDAVFFPAEGCTATWSVGGNSHSGPIVGGDTNKLSQGASPHVYVLGGTAYTREQIEDSLGLLVLGGAGLLLFLIFLPPWLRVVHRSKQ